MGSTGAPPHLSHPEHLSPPTTPSVQRIKLSCSKTRNIIATEKRLLVELLTKKEFEKARIRAEGVIRKGKEEEALGLLELMCELLLQRLDLLLKGPCPPDLVETVRRWEGGNGAGGGCTPSHFHTPPP